MKAECMMNHRRENFVDSLSNMLKKAWHNLIKLFISKIISIF